MSEAAYGDASALHARRCAGRAPRVFPRCRLGFSQMSSAALPGAHAGADASSARAETRPRRRRGRPFRTGTWTRRRRCRANANATLRPTSVSSPSAVCDELRARPGSFARRLHGGGGGGVRGLLPSKAQSRTRALASAPAWWSPYAFAARMTLAFSFSASAGSAPGGGSFGRGWSRGLAGPRRRGRGRAAGGEADGASRGCTRESWIRDSGVAFGRVVARDGGREDRLSARGRASRMGRSPGAARQPRASGRARKGVERRGTRDRDTHARTIVIGRSVSRARAATGTEGADGTRDGCARLGTCASRRLFVW